MPTTLSSVLDIPGGFDMEIHIFYLDHEMVLTHGFTIVIQDHRFTVILCSDFVVRKCSIRTD